MTTEALPSSARAEALEELASAAYGEEVAVTEVIRPAAVLTELSAHAIAVQLAAHDARSEGHWVADATVWRRYDRPWDGPDDPGDARLVGTMHVAYGTPSRFDITVYRATITTFGAATGWTVESLCDEAFAFGGLTLSRCPRASLRPPPPVFKMR